MEKIKSIDLQHLNYKVDFLCKNNFWRESRSTFSPKLDVSFSKTNYYGKYFERLFLSLTGISDAKNKNHPLWDHKSSSFVGSEKIEARNQRIW